MPNSTRRAVISSPYGVNALRRRRLTGFDPNSVAGLRQLLLASTAIPLNGVIVDERTGLGTARAMQPGRANDFDGVDDYVDLTSHISNFTTLTEGSISAWFKWTAGTRGTIFSLSRSTAQSTEFELGINSATNQVGLLHRNEINQLVVYADDLVNDGEWHHIVLSVNSSGNTLYLDGAVASVTYTGGDSSTSTFLSNVTSPDTLTIGANRDSSGYQWHFDGQLFDVRVYDDALNADEVSHVYTFGASGVNPGTDNLVSQHKCDDTHPTIAYDSSGNGRDGTKENITASTFHYTGNDVPYSYQNEVGYSDQLIPRDESDTANDVLGGALEYVGKAPANAALINSNAGTFDGVDDYVDIDGFDRPDSIEFLYYRVNDDNSRIILQTVNGVQQISITQVSSGRISLAVRSSAAVVVYCATPVNTFLVGNWYKVRIEVVYGVSGVGRVLVDGVEVTSATGDLSGDLVTPSCRIGSNIGGTANTATRICDFKVTQSGALVRHYPFSEGGGNTAYDVSGNDNHGTITNATTTPGAGFWANKQSLYHYNILDGFDMVGNFDGTDHLRRTSAVNVNGIAAWIKTDSLATQRYIAGFPGSFNFSINTSGNLTLINNDFSIIETGGTIVVDTWTHVAFATDSDGTRTYINGIEIDYDADSVQSATATLYVGADDAGSSGGEWLGQMSDVYAFSGNVTSAEILALYNNNTAPTNTYLYWPLSDIDTPCNDASGNDRNGTVAGTLSIFKGLRLPAKSDGTSFIHGRAVNHPAGIWHNGAETEIDFTGGIAWPGSASLETSWGFHDNRTNPRFNRERTTGGIINKADRFLAYSSTLSGEDLTSIQDYTLTTED